VDPEPSQTNPYVYFPLSLILPSLPFIFRIGLAAGRYLCFAEYLEYDGQERRSGIHGTDHGTGATVGTGKGEAVSEEEESEMCGRRKVSMQLGLRSQSGPSPAQPREAVLTCARSQCVTQTHGST